MRKIFTFLLAGCLVNSASAQSIKNLNTEKSKTVSLYSSKSAYRLSDLGTNNNLDYSKILKSSKTYGFVDTYVTLNTIQTISANKTFTGNVNFTSANFGLPNNIPNEYGYLSPGLRVGHTWYMDDGTQDGYAYMAMGIDPIDNFTYIQSFDFQGNAINLNPYGGHVGIGTQTFGDTPALFNIRNADWNYATDHLRITNADNEDVFLAKANGNIGISTGNPGEKLDVNGVIRAYNKDANFATWDNVRLWSEGENGYLEANGDEKGFVIRSNGGKKIFLMDKVGIGTLDTKGFTLAVAGPMVAESVKVQLTSAWSYPDYVFKNTYKLPSLNSVEQYIKENQHLPEIPSEKEAKENGMDLGEMNAKLLKKIEEMTLYMIDLKKELDNQKKEIETLKTRK